MLSIIFSLNRIVFDVEDALYKNFKSDEEVDALTKVIEDFRTIRDLEKKIREGTINPPLNGQFYFRQA